MSRSTDNHEYYVYVAVYIVAESLGGTDLNLQEENGHISISGTMPTKYAMNQVWNEVRDIGPDAQGRRLDAESECGALRHLRRV